MASPLRLRILRITLHEPRTNKEIAEVLGLNPASVLHHVRTLVDTGFLIEQPVRRGPRGSRERPYLASGKTWYLEMGDEPDHGAQDLLLDAPSSQEISDLDPGLLDSTRLGFRLSDPTDVERGQAAVPRPAPGDRRAAERSRGRAVEPLSRSASRRPPAYRLRMTWTEITDLATLTGLVGRAHCPASATRHGTR